MSTDLPILWTRIGAGAGVDAFREFLEAGGDANAVRGDLRWTLLHLACEHRNPALVEALVDAGADLDARAAGGWTPLHHAVDSDIDGAWQVHHSLDAVNFELTRVLLRAGASPDGIDDNGRTPRDEVQAYATGAGPSGERLLAAYDSLVAGRLAGASPADLGYAACWLDGGILRSEVLRRQLRHFRGPNGDTATEHYRAGAMRDYLAAHPTVDDEQLAALLEVASAELPTALHGHVFHELVRHPGLTTAQHRRVSGAWDDAGFQRVVRRTQLLRALETDPASPAVLDRCQHDGDAYVHEALLDLEGLSTDRLAWLAEFGGNKRVRRAAAERLRRSRAT